MSVDAVLIAGPTASGKSELALRLAERFGGTVINADSMQVYRELRVLTARPSEQDETRAAHRLYGHVPVSERYSAGRYIQDAAETLRTCIGKSLPIIVGGTGLYFAGLSEGLSPIPHILPETRLRVRARLESLGAERFFAELVAMDPESASIRASDTHRMLRAADVFEETGVSLKQWQKTSGESVLKDMNLARFVLSPPRETLYARIEERIDKMMTNGALEEARAMKGVDPSLPAARALGVPQLLAHYEGNTTLEAALDDMKRETRRYAKRQLTWFRQRMKDWDWIENTDIAAQWERMAQINVVSS